MDREDLTVGMIIQVNSNYPEIEGCLMIIEKIFDYGVVAYITLPNYRVEYWRLEYDEFEVVGAAAFVRTSELS